MPYIDDPELPPVDRRFELMVRIAEHALELNDQLLALNDLLMAENIEFKQRLQRHHLNGHRRHRTKQPA